VSATAAPHRSKGATPVSRYVQGITAEAMRRFGFANSAIIANWTAIAGPSIAAYALPIKLTGGAGRQMLESAGEGVAGPARGATLLLRTDPARSLEIQYLAPQLIERINACLGYRAVDAIRMVQVPMRERMARPPRQAAIGVMALPPGNESRLDRALVRLRLARTGQARHSPETKGSRNLAEL
jgi:hypothetical protein